MRVCLLWLLLVLTRSESPNVVTGFILLSEPLWLITLAMTSFLVQSSVWIWKKGCHLCFPTNAIILKILLRHYWGEGIKNNILLWNKYRISLRLKSLVIVGYFWGRIKKGFCPLRSQYPSLISPLIPCLRAVNTLFVIRRCLHNLQHSVMYWEITSVFTRGNQHHQVSSRQTEPSANTAGDAKGCRQRERDEAPVSIFRPKSKRAACRICWCFRSLVSDV